MARTQTVWDAEGVKRTVRSIDAQEILEGGGSATEPIVYTEADATAQNDGVDVTKAKKNGSK